MCSLSFIINANANSDAYFSKYYSADLASLAETTLAANGDVVLRYDNFRNHLKYSFDERSVSVAPSETDFWQTRYFARADQYLGADNIEDPSHVMVRKVGSRFGVNEEIGLIQSCDKPELLRYSLDKVNVSLTLQGTLTELERQELREEFASTLRGAIRIVDENPAIDLFVTLEKGVSNSFETAPTDAEGATYSCLVQESLEQISLVDFQRRPAVRGGDEWGLTIKTDSETKS